MARNVRFVPDGWYRKPVFGLPVVVAGFMGMFGNVGPLIYSSFAFIVQDIQRTTDWARSDLTLSISFLTFFTALAQPGFGAIVDRFGVRWPTALSLLLMAITLATIPLFVTEVWHLWVGFILAAVLGVANNTMSFIRLAAAWFDRKRGLMIGIVASATGLGLAILPRITAEVINDYGWKGGFVWYGIYIAFITVPVIVLFAQDHPRDLGLRPDGDEAQGEGSSDQGQALSGLTLALALRTRVFWVLAIGILLASFALWGITNQLALLLGDRGMSSVDAAKVATALGLSMAGSRLIIGWTLDRVFAPIVALVVFLGSAVGFWLLASGGTGLALYPAAALLGTGLGAEIELIGFMVSRYFGLRAFGAIYGSIFVGFLIGTAGGPFLLSRAQEILGTYDEALYGLVGVMIVVALMFVTMGRYDRYHPQFEAEGPR
ncbi:MAG: MFS transporter [Pseudomonadota bacterium]